MIGKQEDPTEKAPRPVPSVNLEPGETVSNPFVVSGTCAGCVTISVTVRDGNTGAILFGPQNVATNQGNYSVNVTLPAANPNVIVTVTCLEFGTSNSVPNINVL